ncbi:MAG: hypothetical protein ABIO70_23470, partial [Pseudomonadota bacterium]
AYVDALVDARRRLVHQALLVLMHWDRPVLRHALAAVEGCYSPGGVHGRLLRADCPEGVDPEAWELRVELAASPRVAEALRCLAQEMEAGSRLVEREVSDPPAGPRLAG